MQKIMKMIKALADTPSASDFMVDYEAAMWAALWKVFPEEKTSFSETWL